MSKTERNNVIKTVMEHQTAKRLISLKFRGVQVTSLRHSHTNDLGMIFIHASGRKFLVVASTNIREV